MNILAIGGKLDSDLEIQTYIITPAKKNLNDYIYSHFQVNTIEIARLKDKTKDTCTTPFSLQSNIELLTKKKTWEIPGVVHEVGNSFPANDSVPTVSPSGAI